jgi:hypothetical protein
VPGVPAGGGSAAHGAARATLPAQPRPASPAATDTPARRRYLDVSAVRIQDWLGRTPDLRLRRGASILLSEATGRERWEGCEPVGTEWNVEAGDLDGVVSLVADEADAQSDDAALERLASAAREVVRALRAQLPHCPIQAVTSTGASYADAYEEMERARRDGDLLVDAPPAPPEAVLAKPCDACRQAPVQHRRVWIVDDARDLCAECFARLGAAGGTKGDRPARSPRPERRMKKAVAEAGLAVDGFPDDFEKMAGAGAGAADDTDTQLVLVYADGNGVGGFLSRAADHARRHGVPQKAEIVPALDGATLGALADAVLGRFDGWSRPPVLAHLAGGDDLMVSAPAGDAWPFARELLVAFDRRIAAATIDWPRELRQDLPCLSAGLVFHHRSHPFADVVHLAKGRLREAKRATRGAASSVAFLDLTADGGQAPPSRDAPTLRRLDEIAPQLSAIAQIPRSHRETLVALHRQSVEDDQAAQAGRLAATTSGESKRGESAAGALARRVVDLGNRPLWDAVAGPGADGKAARERLEACPQARAGLRDLLDLARWWPPEAGPRAAPNARPLVAEVVLA